MFKESEQTADYLKSEGMQFEYVDTIAYSDLYAAWRTNNLGRAEPIDQDAVLDYAGRFERGSAAPAVVVLPTPDGYVVLDGVQRLSAAEACDATTFSAYVCSKRTSIKKQHTVRFGLNALSQHAPDKRFILEQSVEILHFQDHASPQEIHRIIGRAVDTIKEEIRYQKTTTLMRSIGYEGKLLSRSKKWFAAMVGKYADATDWAAASEWLLKYIQTCEECRFTNGTVEEPSKEFFDVKRSARKDRYAQFKRKYNEFRRCPEVIQRIKQDVAKKCHLDNLLRTMRSSNTILEKAIKNNEIIHDQSFANEVAAVLRLTVSLCKEVTPRDLRYPDGKHSSIFDKG